MTIEKQLPGIWVVICDSCGERKELDTDPDAEFLVAVQEVRELGYRIRSEGTVRYHEGLDWTQRGRLAVDYWSHTCPDCVGLEKEEITLAKVASNTLTHRDLPDIQQSRPYRMGYEAYERGVKRSDNEMNGPNAREKWCIGWDAARAEHEERDPDPLGFEEDHRTGNDRTERSIKHSYRGEGRNFVD